MARVGLDYQSCCTINGEEEARLQCCVARAFFC